MQTILITGAGSGIGLASALLFAQKGWRVIAGVHQERQKNQLEEYENIHPIRFDVTNPEDIDAIYHYAIENGGIDVLFSNAGISTKGNLESVPDDTIRQVYEVNFFGPAQLIKKFIPYFKQKENGLIMATLSISSRIGFPYDSIYASAKQALYGLLESLSYELRPYNVYVKALVPGPVNTNLKITTFGTPQNLKPAKNLSKILIPDFNTISEAKDVAQAAYEAANDGTGKFEYIIGNVAQEMIAEKNAKGIEDFKEDLYRKIYDHQ